MSDMLKKYEESTAPIVVDARKQAEGDQTTAVNFFDIESTYQGNFTTRGKGDTTLIHSNVDDDTTGNFTDEALEHYDQEVTELANSHHKYNRSNSDSHYAITHANALGTLYSSTITTEK